MRAVARAAIGCGKLCSALDQEYRELAERIQIDQAYIGAPSVDFKSQLESGEPARSLVWRHAKTIKTSN
jgi:hypothetical protein